MADDKTCRAKNFEEAVPKNLKELSESLQELQKNWEYVAGYEVDKVKGRILFDLTCTGNNGLLWIEGKPDFYIPFQKTRADEVAKLVKKLVKKIEDKKKITTADAQELWPLLLHKEKGKGK